MNIKPIKTERDYQRALREIEKLMDAEPNTPKGDRPDVLATLVEAWEEKHCPIEPPDAVEAILFAMVQRGLTRRDLEPFIGSRAHRKRALTLPMIRRLHADLEIPAESLLSSPSRVGNRS
jgi:HTH-type transcriptional regulator/antitoxin HigA